MKPFLGFVAFGLIAVGCAATLRPGADRVTVVTDRAGLERCTPVGVGSGAGWSLEKDLTLLKNQAVALRADTLLVLSENRGSIIGSQAQFSICDKRFNSVRVTNRPDIVKPCAFIRNAEVQSEREARFATVDSGGNVFYILSDTTRTAENTEGHTTYNYEVRRLTGEIYSCQ